jgi:hypothetical protein
MVLVNHRISGVIFECDLPSCYRTHLKVAMSCAETTLSHPASSFPDHAGSVSRFLNCPL